MSAAAASARHHLALQPLVKDPITHRVFLLADSRSGCMRWGAASPPLPETRGGRAGSGRIARTGRDLEGRRRRLTRVKRPGIGRFSRRGASKPRRARLAVTCRRPSASPSNAPWLPSHSMAFSRVAFGDRFSHQHVAGEEFGAPTLERLLDQDLAVGGLVGKAGAPDRLPGDAVGLEVGARQVGEEVETGTGRSGADDAARLDDRAQGQERVELGLEDGIEGGAHRVHELEPEEAGEPADVVPDLVEGGAAGARTDRLGDQREPDVPVQDRVPVEVEVGALAVRHLVDDLAARLLDLDHLVGREGRDGVVDGARRDRARRCVGQAGGDARVLPHRDGAQQLDPLGDVLRGDAAPDVGEQGGGHEAHRRDRHHLGDAPHHPVGQVLDEGAARVEAALVGVERERRSARIGAELLLGEILQGDGRAELEIDAAVAPEEGTGRLEEGAEGLLLLLPPASSCA